MALYGDFFSPKMRSALLKEAQDFAGIPGLKHIGKSGGLESTESLKFLVQLFQNVRPLLDTLLKQRVIDRDFLDLRTKALYQFNTEFGLKVTDDNYQTVLGLEDQNGRVVMGPLRPHYWKTTNEKPIAPLPDFLKGTHVTLFGPPDNAKLCVNAMNAYHRKLKDEAPIVEELLRTQTSIPKWGADDEDSKTPLREDLISAGENLSRCFAGDLAWEENGKKYELAKSHLSLPIKRFPGLALPCSFLFYNDEPLPLHLYDFALHVFKNWNNPQALVFYVPKLENEEEARYIKMMIETTESLIQKLHPNYKTGTVRLMIVLENPRAIFRTHEIMDELYPYFAGASLGWHDFLGSTARLFKEDANYRIPIKADPDIVIKYIKASHELLANVVGERGGIKVGGMYGILPLNNDMASESFQLTLKGYIRDVITQMKRNLNGFWVAHPDFVRLGLALVEAWKIYQAGDKTKLQELVCALLHSKHQREVLEFVFGPDVESLDTEHPRFARSLIVSDLAESQKKSNCDLEEVRYNVFQSLQYLTDWLSGNGCVALPAQVAGVSVRVMDDLATAERSRWEVWHELFHGRVKLEDFLTLAHEELTFIRKDLSNDKKIVQVKWDERTAKWYPVAFNLMCKLMTDKKPPEFATELLLPFTLNFIREAADPWQKVLEIDAEKFSLSHSVELFNFYFEACGHKVLATELARSLNPSLDSSQVLGETLIRNFTIDDINQAAYFHGDIGESSKTLDHKAKKEQSLVEKESSDVKNQLLGLGKEYLEKFGFKFLISAEGRSAKEILQQLQLRLENSLNDEISNATDALWSIAKKRLALGKHFSLSESFERIRAKHNVKGAQISISTGQEALQTISLGEAGPHRAVNSETFFELASLGKTLAAAFCIEFFEKRIIPLSTSVNTLLEKAHSTFRLLSAEAKPKEWADQVTLAHLMSHEALNLHYVNGFPANCPMPEIESFLEGDGSVKHPAIRVIAKPGTRFQYSGGGFIVLEHLIRSLGEKNLEELTREFLNKSANGAKVLSFQQKTQVGHTYAHGYKDDGTEVTSTRLMFPAFAAGAMGTAQGMHRFLLQLEKSFHELKNSSLSHDTAVKMFNASDKGSVDFMGAKMGLGVFVADAGPNKFAIHQGANDGFRCLYLHCFAGPNRGYGLVALCNAEVVGVQFIAEITQEFLKYYRFEGTDFSKFHSQFTAQGMKQEEIVNRGYKELIFSAFEPSLPEPIRNRGPVDSLSIYNKAVGSEIISCTNQKFARAENLISAHEPIFEADLYGAQGKVMDSWESARHNEKLSEDLVLKLAIPSRISFASFSTKYHAGNHVPAVSLEGRRENSGDWEEIIPVLPLEGHALTRVKVDRAGILYSQLRVRTYPDGGLTRLAIYDESLPQEEQAKFLNSPTTEIFVEKIPITQKPLSIPVKINPVEIPKYWEKLGPGAEVNLASAALGAKILNVSNEHYGPVAQIISPYAPLNMFDGFESARSRTANHFESCHLQLAKAATITRIKFDFQYFINNNPRALRIEALTPTGWKEIVPLTNVKAYAGNQKTFPINHSEIISELKIYIHPDGGINRIAVY